MGYPICSANAKTGFDIVDKQRLRHVEADLLHGVFEQEPVFRLLNGVDFGADEFDAVFFENACFRQFHRQIKGGLAPDGGKQRLRTFAANHFRRVGKTQRLHVRAIRQFRVGHDGCRIRIDQYNLIAFLAQRLASLGSGIVELARLADDDRAGADDHDAMEIGSLRHGRAASDWCNRKESRKKTIACVGRKKEPAFRRVQVCQCLHPRR